MENRDPQLWKQAEARVAFKAHFRTYLLVIAGLWLLWAGIGLTSGRGLGYPWPIWPMLGWGIGIVSNYLAVYRRNDSVNQVEDEYRKLGGQ